MEKRIQKYALLDDISRPNGLYAGPVKIYNIQCAESGLEGLAFIDEDTNTVIAWSEVNHLNIVSIYVNADLEEYDAKDEDPLGRLAFYTEFIIHQYLDRKFVIAHGVIPIADVKLAE